MMGGIIQLLQQIDIDFWFELVLGILLLILLIKLIPGPVAREIEKEREKVFSEFEDARKLRMRLQTMRNREVELMDEENAILEELEGKGVDWLERRRMELAKRERHEELMRKAAANEYIEMARESLKRKALAESITRLFKDVEHEVRRQCDSGAMDSLLTKVPEVVREYRSGTRR